MKTPENLEILDLESFEGAHGTTRTRAISIIEKGFNLGLGMLGLGVYFFNKVKNGIPFAMSYWQLSFDDGVYSNDDDATCVILVSKIFVEKDHLVDLDDDDFQLVLRDARNRSGIDRKDYYRLNRLFDIIFQRWVLVNNLTPKVCTGSIPLRWKYYKPVKKTTAILVIDLKCIGGTEVANGCSLA